MEIIETNWREFRNHILSHIENKKGSRLCRGQANSDWKLQTSFHRSNVKKISFNDYFGKLIPLLADAIETIEGREIDVSNPTVNGSFLAYAQHHGLPTPLLDWTYSPYKAAYYAFSTIEDSQPSSSKAAIYVFDHERWTTRYRQYNNYTDENDHVSVLQAKAKGNHRQIYQQGTYMFTNVDDIEKHIGFYEDQSAEPFLVKYLFSVKEKPLVMADLEAMGINAYSLFGGTDGMFRFFKESVFRADTIGMTPGERLKTLLELWQKKDEEERSLLSQPEFPQMEQTEGQQGGQLGLLQIKDFEDSSSKEDK